ncbi:hypothetical protein LINPERPRIM_LOCUS18570 [Linum perenne]
MGAATTATAAGWGTWEELLLGGAVLRHGTRDWDVVAAELRTRFACPYDCTAEVCRAKYEDLQQRYSGCKALFEELRKQRMAELKRALEASDGSIGSLETKIETLKAEKKEESLASHDMNKTESSPLPSVKLEGMVEESLSKDPSKDGLSAGSFTQETRMNWSPECRLPASTEIKQEPSTSPKTEKASGLPLGLLKGRRGKRKRKVCGKEEGSVEESDVLGSSDVVMSGDGQCSDRVPDLVAIFDSISEHKCATVFRRRLDSQKRGRYKRMILRHVDVDTIRSRISSLSLTTAKELFRDLLLLANNALVFYSRTTREYKSAMQLREIVTTSLNQHLKDYYAAKTTPVLTPLATQRKKVPPKGSKANDAVKKTGDSCPPKVKMTEESETLLAMKRKGPGRLKKSVVVAVGDRGSEGVAARGGRKRARVK